jgi:hypothetical protein
MAHLAMLVILNVIIWKKLIYHAFIENIENHFLK